MGERMTSDLKSRLARDGTAAGTMVFEFFVPGLPAIVVATGADFVLYDMEHSGVSFETLKQQVAGCRGLDLAPLVRVPSGDYPMIARALDIGAHGIMVPMVETPEQARRIVAAAHYPPDGQRGAAFGIAHDDYRPGDPLGKVRDARERTLVIALVETARGLENVEAIAAVDGVDVVWLGHFDLTGSMGLAGQFDHPDYMAAVRRIVAAADAAGKPAGFLAADADWLERYWALGFRLIAYGLDHVLLQSALTAGIERIRTLAATPTPSDS